MVSFLSKWGVLAGFWTFLAALRLGGEMRATKVCGTCGNQRQVLHEMDGFLLTVQMCC